MKLSNSLSTLRIWSNNIISNESLQCLTNLTVLEVGANPSKKINDDGIQYLINNEIRFTKSFEYYWRMF
jgi:hypothetical protein